MKRERAAQRRARIEVSVGTAMGGDGSLTLIAVGAWALAHRRGLSREEEREAELAGWNSAWWNHTCAEFAQGRTPAQGESGGARGRAMGIRSSAGEHRIPRASIGAANTPA